MLRSFSKILNRSISRQLPSIARFSSAANPMPPQNNRSTSRNRKAEDAVNNILYASASSMFLYFPTHTNTHTHTLTHFHIKHTDITYLYIRKKQRIMYSLLGIMKGANESILHISCVSPNLEDPVTRSAVRSV